MAAALEFIPYDDLGKSVRRVPAQVDPWDGSGLALAYQPFGNIMATAAASFAGVVPLETSSALAARRVPFDPSSVGLQTIVLCGLYMLNLAGNPGAAVFFLILFWMALRSTQGAFKALMLVGLGVALNQFFVPKSILWTPTRLALSGFCAMRCLVDVSAGNRSVRMGAYFYALIAFCVTAAICSVLSGYYVQIALLKLFNFFTVVAATLVATEAIRQRRIDMTPWFVSLFGTIVVFGLMSIAFGQSTNFVRYRGASEMLAATNSLFNGAFLHPNSHTSLVAPAFVFLMAVTVFSTYRNRWICGVMAGVLAVFMVYSQARTAIVAAFAGLVVIFLYAGPSRFLRGRRLKYNVGRGTMLGLAIIAVVGLAVADNLSGGSIQRSIISFTNKSENVETLDTEDMIRSREGMINRSWANFQESPVFGIGFQVSKDEYFRRNATLFTAPAEKGFLYSALLEEGGVLGTTAFAVFVLLFFGMLLRTRNIPGLAVAVTSFLATTFEVGLFAMGGSGTFFWTMIGAAIMLGDHCWENSTRWAGRGIPVPTSPQPRPTRLAAGV